MKTLISSKKRKELMQLLLENPEKIPGVREAARACSLSPASVSIFMQGMEKDGFIQKGALKLKNPELRALRLLFNVEKIAPLYPVLKKRFGILGMGIYGSWARGTNTLASDLDLWIRVQSPGNEAEIRAGAGKLLKGVQANILFLDEGKMRKLRESEPVFYSALFYSFPLGGEGIA
jgi:predicted nucleotidyltransferase